MNNGLANTFLISFDRKYNEGIWSLVLGNLAQIWRQKNSTTNHKENCIFVTPKHRSQDEPTKGISLMP
jgi:hypothetical protein